MEIKSIGLTLNSVEERYRYIKVMNRDVLPKLRADYGLIDASIVDYQKTGLISVLTFDFESELALNELIHRYLKKSRVEISADAIIEHKHEVLN